MAVASEIIPRYLAKTSLTEMPFGQMPILKIDDVTLSQSVAIDFYLAKTFGMQHIK